MSDIQTLILNQKNDQSAAVNELQINFATPIPLQNKRIALGYLGLYYSWRNVNTVRSNNSFSYVWVNGTTYPVALPDGFYGIADLSNMMQQTMFNNNHYVLDINGNPVYFISFAPNTTYYATTFQMSVTAVPAGGSNPQAITIGKTPQIIIPNSNFQTLVGTVAGTYPSAFGTSVAFNFNGTLVPQIAPTTINVSCSIAMNRWNTFNNVIYQFSPTVPYGSYITVQPNTPIFYDVNDGSPSSISVQFYDENYSPLQIVDPNITVTLLVESKN